MPFLLADVPTDQGLSKRCLFVLTSSKHTIAAATVESSGPEAAEPVPAQLHRVMVTWPLPLSDST